MFKFKKLYIYIIFFLLFIFLFSFGYLVFINYNKVGTEANNIENEEVTDENVKANEIYKDELTYNYPESFVVIINEIPNVIIDLKYYSSDNFTGKRVPGYTSNTGVATVEAVEKLKLVQNELNKTGYGLKIYDAYRPRKASNFFVEWANDLSDISTKEKYYPDLNKSELLSKYISNGVSSHSRGSTIDLTIVNIANGAELDMGTIFDYFGEDTAYDYSGITNEQKNNRKLLKNVMEKYGFVNYSAEWWHYRLIDEPYFSESFDFDI